MQTIKAGYIQQLSSVVHIEFRSRSVSVSTLVTESVSAIMKNDLSVCLLYLASVSAFH